MIMIEPLKLDVREELRNGGEPLPRILQTVKQLLPGQSLRLRATFEPIPLYSVLSRKGFAHHAQRRGEGDWEILFIPGDASRAEAPAASAAPHAEGKKDDAAAWPEPRASLDNRGLSPPEPMIRILDTLEHLAAGEVLEAFNEREPMFLYPELEQRGAVIRVEKQGNGTVHLLIRRGA